MKTEIKYIELKSGFSDNGPAWIALVSFSKSGKTVYFNGKAFQSTKGNGVGGNYFDLETGDEYWISGVKKDLTDRHWAGGGLIGIERRIQEEYLKLIDRKTTHPTKHKITEVCSEIPLDKFHELENEKVKFEKIDFCVKNPNELSITELKNAIKDLYESEINCKYNKGRRSCKAMRHSFEIELEKRENSA